MSKRIADKKVEQVVGFKNLSRPIKDIVALSPLLIFAIFALVSLGTDANPTPVDRHGHLSIVEGRLVGEDMQPASLAGPSLFWSNNGYEGEKYYNPQTVRAFRTDWNASIIRAAMAAQGAGSYLTHPNDNRRKVEVVVDAAIENGLYVIVDWHSHQAEKNVSE